MGMIADGVFMNQEELNAANQNARDAARAENPNLTPNNCLMFTINLLQLHQETFRFADIDRKRQGYK
jgi:hypothetical protein